MAAEVVFGTGTTVAELKVVGCGAAGCLLVEVHRNTALGLKLVGCDATEGTLVGVGLATVVGLKVIGLGAAERAFVEIGRTIELAESESSSSEFVSDAHVSESSWS
jgi:hypothetical protein